MTVNQVKLNPGQTEILLAWKSMMQVLDYQAVLNGVAHSLQELVRSLGIFLDPQLLQDDQVATVRRAFA